MKYFHLVPVLLALVASFTGCGNREAVNEEEKQALERREGELKIRNEIVTAFSDAQSGAGSSLFDALQAGNELWASGALPRAPKGSALMSMDAIEELSVKYPLRRRFRIIEDSPSELYYQFTIEKRTEKAEYKLIRACLSNSKNVDVEVVFQQ